MPKLSPTDWRTQAKIFEKFGCHYVRQKGDHLIYHHFVSSSIKPQTLRAHSNLYAASHASPAAA